jgi:hypothetical protein
MLERFTRIPRKTGVRSLQTPRHAYYLRVGGAAVPEAEQKQV